MSTYFARFVNFILILYSVYGLFSFNSKMQQKIDPCKSSLVGSVPPKNITNSPVFYLVLLVSFENCIICFCSKGQQHQCKEMCVK